MKFDGVKCDECGRVKGEVNHWVTVHAFMKNDAIVGLVVGPIGDNVIPASDFTSCRLVPLDLCGHDCSAKYIAKFVGTLPAPEETKS